MILNHSAPETSSSVGLGQQLTPSSRKQLVALAVLLGIYAVLDFLHNVQYSLALEGTQNPTIPELVAAMPTRWRAAAGDVGALLLFDGALALAGFWLARRLNLPPVYREGAGWRVWFLWPMLLGLCVGGVSVIGFEILASLGRAVPVSPDVFVSPAFAYAARVISNEITFRGFLMGLCAFLFSAILGRTKLQRAALWVGNGMAALTWTAVILWLSSTYPLQVIASDLPVLFLLLSLPGLVAGERYTRDGLTAAIGVQFWSGLVMIVVRPW